MKILQIGSHGDIGRAVMAALSPRHEVITAGRTRGEIRVDMTDPGAVAQMFASVGPLDAVIVAAGDVSFARLGDHTPDSFRLGIDQKLMGQITVVLQGREAVRDGGSFTLTSGILDRDPILGGTNASTANGALKGFVQSAALELPRGQRINAVSPGMLDVTAAEYGYLFPGHIPVASEVVGAAYVKSVEGGQTGQVYEV